MSYFTLRTRALWADGPQNLSYLPDAFVSWDDLGHLARVEVWDGQDVDLDARGSVLTPGFVDGHVHLAQTRIIGAASGPLLEWLDRSTFPEEARFADPTHATAVADAFTAALAAAGTTLAFVYGSVHPSAADTMLDALDRRGLRATAGPVLMDAGAPPALTLPADRALPALEALISRWHRRDGRLEVAVIPRFALSCSMELMQGAAQLAKEHDLWVSTHLSETVEECRVACERFGAPDYLAVYERAGLVHAKAVFAHCIHLSPDERARLADAGAVVAHCPDSNDFLGSGGMPVDDVLDRDIPLMLGTDVAAGRTFRIPRIASSAHDNALRHGRRVDPVRWLWAATRGGALALGRPEVGLLRPGLDADVVLHDVPAWASEPHEILGWLLFHHDAPPARATWVRGRKVWDRATWSPGPPFVWDLPR